MGRGTFDGELSTSTAPSRKGGSTVRMVEFSYLRVALVARNEASCCWWETCCSLSILSSCRNRSSVMSGGVDGKTSPIPRELSNVCELQRRDQKVRKVPIDNTSETF